MSTDQRPDPIAFDVAGGSVGCLLLHGFTGSPPEMRPLGEYLYAKGLTVSGPLLPGHGTAPDHLNRVRWQDWSAEAERALSGLMNRCDVVFVAGLSMGALLAVHMAVQQPAVAGIMLYAPALKAANRVLFLAPVAKHVIRQMPGHETDLTDPEAPSRLWHYGTYPVGGAAQLLALQRRVRRELRRVLCPAMVIYATRDTQITPDSATRVYASLGSDSKELVALHNSGHCLTVDSERDQVFAQTYGFIVRHTGVDPNAMRQTGTAPIGG